MWYFDSGCSRHMSGDKKFNNLKKRNKGSLHKGITTREDTLN